MGSIDQNIPWVERLDCLELEQLKLCYMAIYKAVGVLTQTKCAELEAASVQRRRQLAGSRLVPKHSFSTKGRSTRVSQISIPSSATSNFSQNSDRTAVSYSPSYNVSYSKRFPPLWKMVVSAKAVLRKYDKAEVLEKFRFLTRDNSDKMMLRFIRQHQDSLRAVTRLAKAIAWCISKHDLPEILREGDWAFIDETKDNHIQEFQTGRWAVVGKDKAGRPLSYSRTSLHKAYHHSTDLEFRGLVKLFEELTIFSSDELDGSCVIFDYSELKLDNLDLRMLKLIISLLNILYPGVVSCVLINNAPKFFYRVWKLLKPLMDQDIVDKVKFCDRPSDLLTVVSIDQLPRVFGGYSRHEHTWIPPNKVDDVPLSNTERRKELQEQRTSLLKKFERCTYLWLMEKDAAVAEEIQVKRKDMLAEISRNFWELDPYVRSRTVFDRNGIAGYLRPELKPGAIGQPVCKSKDPFPRKVTLADFSLKSPPRKGTRCASLYSDGSLSYGSTNTLSIPLRKSSRGPMKISALVPDAK